MNSAGKPRCLVVTLGSLLLALGVGSSAAATPPPVLSPAETRALAHEVSGSAALRTVQELALHHRQRGSSGYQAAAEAIVRRARQAGLAAEILRLPADGERFYGTQRSRPAWDATFAELWEVTTDQASMDASGDAVRRLERVASWEDRPIHLAQDSASGHTIGELVDVGAGTAEQHYLTAEGQPPDLTGKLVLTSSQPGAVAPLAVERYGADGIVSWAQNQRSAWWGQDETLVRWGHLDTFPEPAAFAFMVSIAQAAAFRERLAAGETVLLEARVEAGQHPGEYWIPTAVIPGDDPTVADQEIVYSCHLDHQQPGANDNASGCAAILEAARVLATNIADGRLAPPRRTLRFVWPPEIEGTLALLNGRPEFARRTGAVIHMDMVGGDPAVTKAVFHVTRSPASLPHFVDDLAAAWGRWVNGQTDTFTATGEGPFPLVDPAGGREPLRADTVPFSPGSDHQVWAEGSFRIPAVYFNDWPDRYIHTHADLPANLDTTKLLRASFLGAAVGYSLATLEDNDAEEILAILRPAALDRAGTTLERLDELAGAEPVVGSRDAAALLDFRDRFETAVVDSLATWVELPAERRESAQAFLKQLSDLVRSGRSAGPVELRAGEATVYGRRPEPKGTLDGFGYSWLAEQLARHDLPTPKLGSYQGLWGDGYLYRYEALNLVDGRRTVGEIRDALTAVYGPVPIDLVVEFLAALETVGLLEAGDSPSDPGNGFTTGKSPR